MDFVIPFTVKFIAFDLHFRQFLIADLAGPVKLIGDSP